MPLLVGGMLSIIFALPTAAFAQTPPTEEPEQPAANIVNCPGSLLHGRTITVANTILYAIPDVTACDQVTTNHLAIITGLNLNLHSLTSLQTNDFDGLDNLQTLRLNTN